MIAARTRGASVPTAGGLTRTAVVLLGIVQFVAAYDTTSMSVAMSRIVKDLDTTVQGVQSALALYPLTTAAFMLAGGKLADVWGRRRVLTIGMIVYAAGALTTSVAPNLTVMTIGWSLLEGLGAALMLPAVYTIVLTSAEGRYSHTQAVGLVGAMSAAGAAAGPLIAGAIAGALSWRLSFAFEVVAVLVILAFVRRIPDPPLGVARPRLDMVGSVMSAVGFALFALGVMMGSYFGWLRAWQPVEVAGIELIPEGGVSPTLILMGAGLGLIAVLVAWLRLQERRGNEPLVHLGTFRSPSVTAGLLASVARRVGERGIFFVIPIFLQVALGSGPFKTGLIIMPMSVCAVLVGAQAGRLARRWARRTLLRAGLMTQLGGLALMAGLVGRGSLAWDLIPGIVVFGVGIGLAGPPESTLVVSGVPRDRRGEASGLFRSANNLGTAMGIAIAGSILLTLFAWGAEIEVKDSTVLTARQKTEILSIQDEDIRTVSNAELNEMLKGESSETVAEVVDINAESRDRALRLTMLAMGTVILLGLVATARVPVDAGSPRRAAGEEA